MTEYCAGCGKPMTPREVEWLGRCCRGCGEALLCEACDLCESCAEDEQGAYDDDLEEADAEFA